MHLHENASRRNLGGNILGKKIGKASGNSIQHLNLNTIPQAAKFLGISERLLWDEIKARKIGHVCVGTRGKRISDLQIQEYIQSSAVPAVQ